MRRILLLALAGLAPARAGPGLVATYSDGAVTVREVVPTPNFYLERGETLHPALQENFGAVFRGRLVIHRNGRYELFPGAAELEIDNRPASGPGFLATGEHEFQLRYRSAGGERGVRLEWQGPGVDREPVPVRLFSHDDAEAPRDAERLAETGRRLAAELGCANCHLAAETLGKRPAPPLDGIGSRTNAAWLKHWLDNPQAFRASAAMPRAARRSDANDLAEYLMTLTGAPPPETLADGEAGSSLFRSLGCVACHGKAGVPLEGLGSKTAAGHLQRYLLNPFAWEPSGLMPALDLDERQAADLAGYLVLSKKPGFERQPLGGDAERGKKRFTTAGCVACHQLEGGANQLVAPDMATLDPERGCLSDHPADPAPLFTLKPSQRAALRAFAAFYAANPDRTRSPIHDFRARLEQLRCNACHGGRQAPSLDGLGEKMRTSSLRRALSGPAQTHDSLAPPMPHYHPQHVGILAEGFARVVGLAPGDGPAPPRLTSAQQVEGRAMLGSVPERGGLGCTGCHGWGERAFPGAPDLTQASQRLRYDWFLRWMRDPQRIHPGTAMPSPFAGQTPEQSRAKLETLWAGLAAPASAVPPPGFEQPRPAAAPPPPSAAAVVVRRDMPEAQDAIVVGLPGGVSYCFDPGEARLLYAWTGGPDGVGQIFYRQSAFPLRIGEVEGIPQFRFVGYAMVDGAPEFHVQADGLDVYERILPRNGELVRQFRLPTVDRPAWLLVAAHEGARIATSLGSGLERLQLPRGENIRFEVRIGAP